MAGYTNVTVYAVDADGDTGVEMTALFTGVDDTNGNKVRNANGRVLLFFRAAADASSNLRIDCVPDPYNREVADGYLETAIGNSELWVLGPYTPRLWNQVAPVGDVGYLHIDYDTYVPGAGLEVEIVALSL